MEGCCCAGGVAGVSDPLTVIRFTTRFALQRRPSGDFALKFVRSRKPPRRTHLDKGKGGKGPPRDHDIDQPDICSHRGREFVFPASLEFMSFPGAYAGVELLVEFGPLLGEDTSREYEGAGLALRTRDPPKCWDSD